MKGYIFFILAILFVLLETSFFSALWPDSPPFLLVPLLVFLLFFERNESRVLLFSFFAGLLQDLVSATFFGLYTLTLLFSSFLFLFLRGYFFSKSFRFWWGIVGLYYLSSQLLASLIFLLIGGSLTSSLFFRSLLWGTLTTLLFSLPLYPLLQWLRPKGYADKLEVLP